MTVNGPKLKRAQVFELARESKIGAGAGEERGLVQDLSRCPPGVDGDVRSDALDKAVVVGMSVR